jgi:hypothetical protein
MTSPAEKINHPQHYGGDTVYEHIKVVEAWGLLTNYPLAIALKHVCRAGKKDGSPVLEDLRKARWYLDWEIRRLERAEELTDITPPLSWEKRATSNKTLPPAPVLSKPIAGGNGVDSWNWSGEAREFSSKRAAETWMKSCGIAWTTATWEAGHMVARYTDANGSVARLLESDSTFTLMLVDPEAASCEWRREKTT